MLVDYNPVELAVSDAQQYRGEFMPVKGRLVIYFIFTEAEITYPYCKFLYKYFISHLNKMAVENIYVQVHSAGNFAMTHA